MQLLLSTHLYRSSLSVSVTRPTLSHFVSPSNSFPGCFRQLHFPLIILVLTRCSHFFSLHGQKKVALHLHMCILFISDLVITASCNTVLFDFFTIYEIHIQNCPGLTSIHQNGFKIALQGSSDCVNGDVFVGIDFIL